MIHEVFTDSRQVNKGGDAMFVQLFFGAYAGTIQNVWAAIGTATYNNLFIYLDNNCGAIF